MAPLEKKCPLCLELTPYDTVKIPPSTSHYMYFNCSICDKSFIIGDQAYEMVLYFTKEAKETIVNSFVDLPVDHVRLLNYEEEQKQNGSPMKHVIPKSIPKGSLQC